MRSKSLFIVLIFACAGLIAEPTQRKKNRISESLEKSARNNNQNSDQNDQEENESNLTFNEATKRKEAIALVESGIDYLKNHTPFEAFQEFTRNKEFTNGELYLVVFETNGVCLAHGQETDLVWKNLINMQGDYGAFIIQDLLKKAHDGGGWIDYRWRNATKNAYVKEVTVGDKAYIISTGYYPHSQEDIVINMVKSAVSLFNNDIKEGHPKEEALSTFSYPLGQFVFGDLYLYALDFQGLQVAHGGNPGLIGTRALNYKDANGKYVNQEIIKKLKESAGNGIWIEYLSNNAPKKAYAEKVVDAKGKEYFIACGYYPDESRKNVEELVRRGYQYMKTNGKTEAAREFNNKNGKEFRYGDLSLFVYDLQGNVVANGENPTFVGQNHFDLKDDDGNFYVRELIKKAQNGGGSIEYKIKKSFKSSYVELIDLGIEKFVIGSGIYPISKDETMMLIAKSAAGYLKSSETEEAFREFVKKDGSFIRGDLSIFAFDEHGICYAHGDDYNLIWRNLMGAKDDNGKAYIQEFINTAKAGAADLSYIVNGKTKRVHIEPVTKNNTLYVVGSEYYI